MEGERRRGRVGGRGRKEEERRKEGEEWEGGG